MGTHKKSLQLSWNTSFLKFSAFLLVCSWRVGWLKWRSSWGIKVQIKHIFTQTREEEEICFYWEDHSFERNDQEQWCFIRVCDLYLCLWMLLLLLFSEETETHLSSHNHKREDVVYLKIFEYSPPSRHVVGFYSLFEVKHSNMTFFGWWHVNRSDRFTSR